MAKAKEVQECSHQGYLMKDGQLVCAECGALTPSEKWQANVYGAQETPAGQGLANVGNRART